MMNRKSLILPIAAAACFLLPSTTVFAQTATPTTQKAAKPAKQINFTVTNKTANTVNLQSGSQQLTIAAGQSQQVKAPVGTKVVTTSDSSLGQSGTVVTEVTDTMNGSTVNVR